MRAAKSFPVCILTDIALHVRSAGAKHKIHQILLYIPLDITKRALIARIYRIIQRYRIKLFFHYSSSIPQLLAPLSLFYGHPPQRVQISADLCKKLLRGKIVALRHFIGQPVDRIAHHFCHTHRIPVWCKNAVICLHAVCPQPILVIQLLFRNPLHRFRMLSFTATSRNRCIYG